MLLAWAPVSAAAIESVSSGTITLNQVLELVERDNPEILAARKRWAAFQKRVPQAATPDKPRLDIERMYVPSGSSVLTQADEKSLAITQEIPFPTTLYLRRGAAAKEAAMAEQSYRAKVRDVLARTRSAYAMLYLARRSFDIINENIELMRRFARVAESKYTAGHASQSDALKAQVELTKMLNMGVMLEQDRETAAAMLSALLNRDAREPLGLPAEPALPKPEQSLESVSALAMAERPELKEALLNVERAGKSLAIARSEYLPDLMLQYRQRNDPMRGRTRDAVLGLSIPLWFWKPAAMAAEAKAEREMAEAELAGMKAMTSAEVKTAWVRAQTARRLADIYRTSVLPQADQAIRVAEAGYQANKTSFLDLLDAQRSLLSFRVEYYQFLADYEQRMAELERVVGRGL
ncbi:MAG: TolC family protein [Elusimicrobiota bacterium]|nr:MAG: TolC family protein [Elusimicrobiota bacterium]